MNEGTYLVMVGNNNAILQQERITLRVTNHRLVFEFPQNVPAGSTPGACAGKHADFTPFWYISGVETSTASKSRTLLQFTLKDSYAFSVLLPNATEAKAITQVCPNVGHVLTGGSLLGKRCNRGSRSISLRC